MQRSGQLQATLDLETKAYTVTVLVHDGKDGSGNATRRPTPPSP